VGIDMDGTVVHYDRLFHRLARKSFGLPAEVPVEKASIRAWLRSQTNGEEKWVTLQGLAYGPEIRSAQEAPGLRTFLAGCRNRGWELHLVSHKGELSACARKFPLRRSAWNWLRSVGLVGSHAFAAGSVHFASSREEKIRSIRDLGLCLFVDDLPEILEHPLFPKRVERWHYIPRGAPSAKSAVAFRSWWDAAAFLGR